MTFESQTAGCERLAEEKGVSWGSHPMLIWQKSWHTRFLKACLSPSQVSSLHPLKRTTGLKQHSLLLRENRVRTRLDRPHYAVTVMVQSVLDLLATRRDPK